jgi:hypothetical protein
MGRAAASEVNKTIALAFAKIITQRTDNPHELVARCGRYSIYSTFQEMFPYLVREGHLENREGVSEVEFNKVLQVIHEFKYLDESILND